MEFREHAAKEAAALAERLLPASADLTRQRLRAFRSAIEGAAKALESALTTTTPAHVERDIQQLVERLSHLAREDAAAAAGQVSAALEATIADLRTQLDAAQAQHAALDASLRESHDRAHAFEQRASDAEQQVQAVRAELARVQDAAARLEDARAEGVAAFEEQSRARAHAEREVHAVRSLLDTAQAELASTTTDLEMAIASRAAAEETLEAVESAKTQIETAQAAVSADLETANARLRELDDASAERDARIQSLDTALADRDARLQSLESALADRDARLQSADAALADRNGHVQSVEAALTDRDARLESAAAVLAERDAQAQSLESALAESAARVRALEASVAETAGRAHAAESALGNTTSHAGSLESALEERTRQLAALEVSERQATARAAVLEATLQDTLQATTALAADHERTTAELFDRLIGSFEALASAPTIADLLTTSVTRLHDVFARVALFRLKSNRLEGECQVGFDQNSDIGKITVPLGMDSLLTRAAVSATPASLAGTDLATNTGLPFAGGAAWAIALPIVVHGETLAVVYADDGGEVLTGVGHQFAERFARALLQHAGAVLMRLSAELKALAELRDYARSLCNEIEEMFVADSAGGKPEEELQRRLGANLEYARSIYATRVAVEGPAAASLLEDELRGLAEGKGTTAFGRALAALASPAAERTAAAS
jgi:chromosome segregation ATPase